jgi:hypothetical protein
MIGPGSRPARIRVVSASLALDVGGGGFTFKGMSSRSLASSIMTRSSEDSKRTASMPNWGICTRRRITSARV